ncbi:MAG: CapA family protein, partial [Anaerolineaceae bacterium]|nr:CapA family protein [Anaerolineaceae bacterium]
LTNLEHPQKKMGPVLSIDPKWASILQASGFNVVSLANNHVLDMGESGLQDTLEYCHSAGLSVVGAGRNLREASQPLILEKEGIKIGLLAFAEVKYSIATEASFGAAPIDPISNFYTINALKQDVDHTIIILHAGNEFYQYPRPGLVKLCRYYVELGASAVICHHAYVPLGYEVYQDTPIFYGTGNFYFPSDKYKIDEWRQGYMVSLSFFRNFKMSFEITPYRFNVDGIHVLEENERSMFLEKLEERSNIIHDQASLQQQWESYCQNEQMTYVQNLYAYNKFDRLLFRNKVLKPTNFPNRTLKLLNYYRCDSHREAIIQILDQFFQKTSA